MSPLRLAALAGLMLLGSGHWARQVEPEAGSAMLAMVPIAFAAALALRAAATLPRAAAAGARAGVGAAALGLILLACGAPAATLAPDEWDVLVAGIGQGMEALPSLRIPYRGGDEWTRTVVLAGGGLLALAAAALVLAGARPRVPGAAVALGLLYGIPVVERQPGSPYLDGALLALGLAALLWADRVRRQDAAVAATLVAGAACVALVAAPTVDAERPWLDYERIAEQLEGGRTSTFRWDHRYGPLYWPRDGREVLRVRAQRRAYWKASALERFDGLTWRRADLSNPTLDDVAPADLRRRWVQELRVTVRALRSREFVAAGSVLDIVESPRVHEEITPGARRTVRGPLRRGDTYTARVYTPRPDATQLRDAGSDYPDELRRHTVVGLPGDGPPPARSDSGVTALGGAPSVRFPFWDERSPVLSFYDFDFVSADGLAAVLASPYGRMYRLAQRIKAASADPYEFVRAVQRRVRDRATYEEDVPAREFPLDAFMFTDRRGYCQHFSGAMALMLRMGGVPARVATGFSPGTLDRESREWVVRDQDAHSWVEVYFPDHGWVTFDPTPAVAPARSQSTDESQLGAGATPQEALDATAGDRGQDPLGATQAQDGQGAGAWPWLAGGAVVLVLTAGGWVLARRRRVPDESDPALAELRRALARTGRPPGAGLTLAAIEAGLGEGAGYVRALRDARFGGHAQEPTLTQRRALRRDLTAGLGPLARLRGWWALPPRVPGGPLG